ncbi:MAG: McrBC 5-methylcytosine restriction system component-like protein [uncultured bacterium]|nr:MAG: McrBC 5-methylcytosine restriction system component-like protein [uncultured bacterium]
MNEQGPVFQKETLILKEWDEISPALFFEKVGQESLSPSGQKLGNLLNASHFLEIQELRQGISLKTTSYVGKLNFDSFTLKIKPKLPGLPLLELFRYGYGLKNIHLYKEEEFNTSDNCLQDILIHQLLGEIHVLRRQGYFREYQKKQQRQSSLKGRIDFPAFIGKGKFASSQLPCVFRRRTSDNALNQMLRFGLQLSYKIAEDHILKLSCKQSLDLFPEPVSDISDFQFLSDLIWAKENRLNAHYQPAIRIIKILLSGQGGFLDETNEKIQIPGFLFDMNRLFQSVIDRFLRENLFGFSVLSEHSLTGMLGYSTSHNPQKRRAPIPRPDYVIQDNGKSISILDAKYRDLWEKPLSREMLYQLGMYALVHSEVKESTILYPTMNPHASEMRISISDPVNRVFQGCINLRPVLVQKFTDLTKLPPGAKADRSRSLYAQYLAFGKTPDYIQISKNQDGLF